MTQIPRSQIVTTRRDYQVDTHFVSTTNPSELPAILTPVGTGAGGSILTVNTSLRPGVMRLVTGSGLSPSASMSWRTPLSIIFGSNSYTLSAAFRTPVLSTPTDNFVNIIGFGGALVGGGSDELVNGAYLYQDGSNFYLCNKNSGGAGYAIFNQVSTNAWNDLVLTVNGATNLSTATLNGETISLAGLPTDATGLGCHIFKYGGTSTVSNSLDVDYLGLKISL